MRLSPFAFVLAGLVLLLAFPRGLAADWIRYDAERATVFFDGAALSSDEMARFTRLVDAGIGHIESYLRAAAGPGGLRTGRIIYRVGDAVPYSTTRGRTIHLPLERVRSDSAPYLHETVHVLVPSPNRSTWLAEGFASYVESHVSETFGGYDAHVFSRTGNQGVDGEAGRWLARDAGRAVLPYIGAPGQPPEMLADRRRVAAPFYVMAQSFTKFLVERLGLQQALVLVMSPEPELALERASGRPAEAWKAEWLVSIDAGA